MTTNIGVIRSLMRLPLLAILNAEYLPIEQRS